MIPQLSIVALAISLAVPAGGRPPETVSVSELPSEDQQAVHKLLAELWEDYEDQGGAEKHLTTPPDPEELECTLYPNGFECSHENYWVSCNWDEGWCQAADDWPG